MVDDYLFPDRLFNYEEFTTWLQEQGFQPNIVRRESELTRACDETIGLIGDENQKNQVVQYIEAKKYPCSLFVATWYLLRLGHIKSSIFDGNLVAKKLINILPLSFKSYEDKAFEIIKSTQYYDAIVQIENRYFEGRQNGRIQVIKKTLRSLAWKSTRPRRPANLR